MHLPKMLFKVIQSWPVFVCFSTALCEASVGFAVSIVDLMHGFHMPVTVVDRSETPFALGTVRIGALKATRMSSRMLPVQKLLVDCATTSKCRPLTLNLILSSPSRSSPGIRGLPVSFVTGG